MKYAAYDDFSIYGIGETPEAAIEDARQWGDGEDGEYQTAPVSDELFEIIRDEGWHGPSRSFRVDRSTGYIVDTTDEN